jgi:aminopeptidase N
MGFEVRQVGDILSGQPKSGFFYMAVGGTRHGNFDVICDPKAEENILIGQLSDRNNRSYFNVWTSFASRSRRKETPGVNRSDMSLANYRIDATVTPDLALKAVTRFTGTPRQLSRAFAFAISERMRVLEAKIDGQPAEVFQHESPRADLIRASEDHEFLVVAPAELDLQKPHEFEIRHEGEVIATAGERVYYVGARSTWYPRRGTEFARYELTFRYPKDLGFVATGDIVDDKVQGDWRITRRKTDVPIRFAAFNLGDYKSIAISHDQYRIEVYANRNQEGALKPRQPSVDPDLAKWTQRRPTDPMNSLGAIQPNPDPPTRLDELAHDVAGAFEYMIAQFGPPPLKTLLVSPIPGGFGQGFPGLLYLSTFAYLDPSQRPPSAQDRFVTTFFSDLLDAHEIAHQWWGNLVIGEGYQDAWLTEALSNYSALLYLEKKKGGHTAETILDDFRTRLLELGPNARTFESAGPISWGYRLESSQSPDAWHHIIYEKGAWVLHMLRRKMGDERFMAMLRALSRRYQYKAISTDEFRRLAAEFMPPHTPDSNLVAFFDTWVYGTGIPVLKLNASVSGGKVTGTVTQSGVPADFSTSIPIEVQSGRQKTLYWVVTSDEPVPFSFPVKDAGAKVALATKDGLFTVKN